MIELHPENLIPGGKVKVEHREMHDDLRSLEVDELLIWELEDGEKFGPAHSIRNTMRACARMHGLKFKSMQYGAKVYVVRVK